MSIISWLFKPKREMAKPNTRPVKMGKYTITSHAQNRTVQPDRRLTKWHMVDNLFAPPNVITPVKMGKKGPSYSRIGRKATTSINPINNHVTTIRVVSKAEANKYHLSRKRGRIYVKSSKRNYHTTSK